MKYAGKISILLIILMTATMLIACGQDKNENAADNGSETVGSANPFAEYDSLKEAEDAAGFSFTQPTAPANYENLVYRAATDGSMIEVIFYNDDKSEEAFRTRKGPGDADISGDYNEYSDEVTEKAGDIDVIMQTDNDGNVYVAKWYNNDYAYAIDIPQDGSLKLSKDTVLHYVSEIMGTEHRK